MNPRRSILSNPYSITAFIGFLVFFITMALRFTGSLEFLELSAYDWFIRLSPKFASITPRVVIISVSEHDIQNEGQWPLSDENLARALSILIGCRPRAVGVDIFRDIPVPPGSEELDSLLADNPNIIAVMKFGGTPGPKSLKDTDRVGFNDMLVDSGGVVRRGLLFLDNGENVAYSFALRLALLYLHVEGVAPEPDVSNPEHIRLGQTTIKPFERNDGCYVRTDDRGYQFLLDFRDDPSMFPSFSLTSLLAGEVDPSIMEGKVILLGTIASDVKDVFYSPCSRSLQADEHVFGIHLHAQIVSQLIRLGLGETALLKTMSEGREMLWILAFGLLGVAVGFRMRSPLRFSIYGFAGIVALFFIAYVAFLGGWWVPLVPSSICWLASSATVVAYASNQERKERLLLMQIFSRHVAPEVAENLWQQRDQILEGGRPRPQKMVVTVLFSDLKGFTPVAERMDPLELIDWLNTYMEAMTRLVMDHGGVVDDYAGDGIKANFGVPLARTDEDGVRQDAVNAVRCALAMEKEMHRVNVLLSEKKMPAAGMRIGIFTGPVVAGALGSADRLKYTTIGNTVNIASRLESFGRKLVELDPATNPCRILIGESTLRYLSEDFIVENLGEEKLKGQTQNIGIHRVIGLQNDEPEAITEKGIK